MSKHLKTALATKWTVGKPNNGWTRISGGPESTRTTTYNPTSYNPIAAKGNEAKSTTTKKQSVVRSVSATSNKTTGTQIRKLTDADIAKKRSLGLCYRCDEKYSPTHRCKNRQLQVMILQPCEGEDEEELEVEMRKMNRFMYLSYP